MKRVRTGLGTCVMAEPWPETGVDSALRYVSHGRTLMDINMHT